MTDKYEEFAERRRAAVRKWSKSRKGRRWYKAYYQETMNDPDKHQALLDRIHRYYDEGGGREKHLEYMRRPAVKRKIAKRARTPEFQSRRRERQSTEEYKEWQREYKRRKYWETKAAESISACAAYPELVETAIRDWVGRADLTPDSKAKLEEKLRGMFLKAAA